MEIIDDIAITIRLKKNPFIVKEVVVVDLGDAWFQDTSYYRKSEWEEVVVEGVVAKKNVLNLTDEELIDIDMAMIIYEVHSQVIKSSVIQSIREKIRKIIP